jgi:hypothetical protein
MLFSRCQRFLTRTVLTALALSATVTAVVLAKPSKPSRPGGFRLFANAINVFTVNRVQCRIFSDGSICATGSSTVGGGIWPRGSANQYVFGSGINIAGVIESGDRAVNGFAGDTAGGFFNNTAGTSNGVPVRDIFSSNDPADAAAWPDEALVPEGDATAELFDLSLQGNVAASQGDLWFVSWEGDPANLASRTHPLGVLVETRAMGWNFPVGNQDIIYLIYTFYNITSTRPEDYANVRPSLRPLLLEKAADFHALNTAKYGINLPEGGYRINDMFAAFTADMDVAQADANFAGVNVPFSLGYTYENTFSEQTAASLGWTFDPAIFGSAPFFNGVGFVGVKYLGSPVDPETGAPVGLTLFGTFSRSTGSLQDPTDDKQLYRYITGGLLPTDGACSLPNPLEEKICFVNISSPADMRFFQSSGPIDLAPGGQGSITVAYIFAAPVASGNCPGVSCNVTPAPNNASLNILGNPTRMASGVNTIDTMQGYLGNTNGQAGDTNASVVTQEEFRTVPGSLLNKALIAQNVFDNKFLLPFAPERPEYFLVPGNNQVTVLWAQSLTETNGDPFFEVASQPSVEGTPNPLYDPNFRQRDVEGYRIYRGRTDNPSELQLIAQFDYAPDATGRGVFTDFRGLMNPVPGCGPELNADGSAPSAVVDCPVVFSTPAPGEPYVGSVDVDLIGLPTQVTPGNRVLLASGASQLLPGTLDTAFKDIAAGRLASGVTTELNNSGVPFIFVDRGVRNSLRYFYAVTAFDVNSLVSGPSSLESARTTKAVTPTPAAANQEVSSTLVTHVIGRDGVNVDETISGYPTLDPATGKFSGPMPAADGGVIGFVGEFASSIIQPDQSGALTMRLDSLHMGQYDATAGFGGTVGPTIPTTYFLTVANATDSFQTRVDLPQANAAGNAASGTEEASAFFPGLTVDPATAQKFEGSPPFTLQGQATVQVPPGHEMGGWGVGCRFADFGASATGADCFYNGSRWFAGPSPTANETQDNPNAGNCAPNFGALGSAEPLTDALCVNGGIANVNNAGALPGVTTIFQPLGYIAMNGQWRNLDWVLPTVRRAADFNVYWGVNGLVDSVIDVTHNVTVPFQPYMGGGYGILNTAAGLPGQFDTRPTVLTVSDIGCVPPFVTGEVTEPAVRIPCAAAAATQLSQTAQLGQVAFAHTLNAAASGAAVPDVITAPPATDPGFLFYIAGDVFLMSMPALPAQGTVWSLRTYVGTITGTPGSFTFNPPEVRPFTAIGATSALQFGVSSVVAAPENSDLGNVHTVPDPYYVQSAFEASTEQKVMKFVGLPDRAIIRIYSASGVLVRLLEHNGATYSSTSTSQGSEMDWDLRNRNNQVVASGVYFYHVEAGSARRVGRFTVVNFAQ